MSIRRRCRELFGVSLLVAGVCSGCATPSVHGDLAVVAGTGTAGFEDGQPGAFHKPIRLAPAPDGAVVVADIFNHAVRLVSKDGVVQTLAGHPDRKGHADGPAATARFASPHGVAYRADGVIAVAEAENHTVRLLTPVEADRPLFERQYLVSTLAGRPGVGGFQDGAAEEAMFQSPHAVAWLPDGGLLVADIGNARLRRVANGKVETLAGGDEADPAFTYLMDLAVTADGAVVLIDAGDHRVLRFTADTGLEEVVLDAVLATPHGIAVAPDGTLLVAELDAHQVSAIDASGHVTRVAGTGLQGTWVGQLNRPAAVLVHDGRLWIADLDNHQLKAIPWGASN